MNLTQTPDFIINHACLNRASARAVDFQDNACCQWLVIGLVQRLDDIGCRRIAGGIDRPADFDHRRMFLDGNGFLAGKRKALDRENDKNNQNDRRQLEKDTPPAACRCSFRVCSISFSRTSRSQPFSLMFSSLWIGRLIIRHFHSASDAVLRPYRLNTSDASIAVLWVNVHRIVQRCPRHRHCLPSANHGWYHRS